MDPPPPLTADSIAEAHIAPAANPTSPRSPAHNHPPYAEMITAAIGALKERGGSSKRAITKYIESNYSKLPPTHSALLSHHLKRLKNSGQVLMVKNSYKLARSANVPVAVNGNGNPGSDSTSVGPKKRPGRPPKNAQATVPNVIPVFAPEGQKAGLNMAVGPGSVNVSVNGDASSAGVGMKRGRGRPPKQGGVNNSGLKRRPGRPPKSLVAQPGGGDTASAAVGTGAAAPGRPKRSITPAGVVKSTGRPRGRPPKPKNVVAPPVADGGAVGPMDVGLSFGSLLAAATGVVVPAARKRRGRPPKAGLERKKPWKPHTVKPKKSRRLSGKPLGRPKKAASNAVARAPFQQQMAYGDIKGKLEHLQSKVKQVVSVVKPCLNDETAISALQELELLASMDVNAPTNVQIAPTNVQSAIPQLQEPQIMEVKVIP